MTDPILLFMAINTAALLLLGGLGSFLPRPVMGFAVSGLGGLGALLCLPPLMAPTPASLMPLPIGPPGMSLHLTLDPVGAFFLLSVLGCGTAVAAFAAAGAAPATPRQVQAIPLSLAGLSLSILASDAVSLALGLTLVGAALAEPAERGRSAGVLSLPMVAGLLLLIALCLLAPHNYAPDFAVIRAAPRGGARTSAAAALALAGGFALCAPGTTRRHWTGAALMAGAVIPTAIDLLLRLVIDLPGVAAQAWWGFILLLAGSAVAVTQGWQATRHPDLNGSVAGLTRRQGGLMVVGLGLTLVARSADLPGAAAAAMAASLLLTAASSSAGTLAVLAAQVLAQGAAANRLARLGGLLRPMPVAAGALAAALLALTALPPAAGFAALWLLFQAILSAPRTGGLIAQLPLAVTAAALAASTALATTASVRLIGIVVLSRPRSVRGSAAHDVPAGQRSVLLVLGGSAIVWGVVPGALLRALADPAILAVTGAPLGNRVGWTMLNGAAGSVGYAPLPVLALLALAVGSVMLVTRRPRAATRLAAIWSDGAATSARLPFGEPTAQSAGAGFLPHLPDFGLNRPWFRRGALSSVPNLSSAPVLSSLPRPPPAPALSGAPIGNIARKVLGWRNLGFWLVLLAFGALLLALSLTDPNGVRGWA